VVLVERRKQPTGATDRRNRSTQPSTILSKAGSDDFASSFACMMAAQWSQPRAQKRPAMIAAHGGPAWRAQLGMRTPP
jgi:hypothetical protein